MADVDTSSPPTISRRALLRTTTVAAVAVHLLGAPSLASAYSDTSTDVGERWPASMPPVFGGTILGPPRGARTNVLRVDRTTMQGRQTIWRAGDGRQLFLPEIEDEVILGYFDPFRHPHASQSTTTTFGAIEHEIRSHFGDRTHLEVTARLRTLLG